jgi:hypothetical protein
LASREQLIREEPGAKEGLILSVRFSESSLDEGQD